MKDPLQDRLKAWAALHEANPAQLDALSRRISGMLATHRPGMVERSAIFIPFFQKLGYACAGGLLVLLIFGIQHVLRPGGNGAPDASEIEATPFAIAGRNAPMQALFKEASRLFPRQLRWVAQSNGEVGLGVESEMTGSIPNTPPMLVRLVVLSRKRSETAWREAWTTEIIVRAEDLVDVTPSRLSNNRMHFWIFPLQNGKMAIETDMTLEQPLKIASRLNTVVGIGAPVEVATVRMEDTEYKILQTVEPVCNPGDVPS